MKSNKKVLLVSNYRADKQKSMLRFRDLLVAVYHQSDRIEELFPGSVLGTLFLKTKRFSKWAAYIDKYFLFPKKLKRTLHAKHEIIDLVHIIDHSNSMYLPHFKRHSSAKLLVTCHDLIAVRTALGEFPFAPKTSSTGKKLQSWIKASLNSADYYSCDSNQTKEDLNRLIPKSIYSSSVIHLGTQPKTINDENCLESSEEFPFDLTKTDFILHVGSSSWYKNRKAVLASFKYVLDNRIASNIKLVLVGPEPQKNEIDQKMVKWIGNNKSSIISLSSTSEESLRQLYLNAKVLLFPSYIEGFGWPPLEAAVQGCPVITTRSGAIQDLLGNYPKYINSQDQQSIDAAVVECLQAKDRKTVEITLPDYKKCRDEYFMLYNKILHANN